MHLRLVLIAALAAGCYTPSIAPCLYACDGMKCPSGLTCMSGMCSNAETGACGADDGDGGVDAPHGPTTHVTIEVRNFTDNPFADATVIFTDALGASVAPNAMTDGAGMASADIPVHSNVTIVRGAAGGDLDVTTFVDIWPDAHLVSQFAHQQLPDLPVTVGWAIDGTSTHKVFTSCGGNASLTSSGTSVIVNVPRECASFDVLVVAANGANSGMVPAASTTSVTVPLAPSRQFMPAYSGQASGGFASLTLEVNAYQTAAMALTVPFTAAMNALSPFMSFAVPTNAKLMMQLVGAVGFSGVQYFQRNYDRIGGATSYSRSLSNVFMEWAGPLVNQIANGKLTWQAKAPGTLPIAPPTTVFAAAVYRRGSQNLGWHVIGPASMVTSVSTTRELVFPLFAAPQPFVPQPSDTPLTATIETYLVTPATVDPLVRSFLEQRRTTLDVWEIVGLNSVSVAKTP